MSEGYCTCPLAGVCVRHGYKKTKREHQICQGVSVSATVAKQYRDAWELGTYPSKLDIDVGEKKIAVGEKRPATVPAANPGGKERPGTELANLLEWFGKRSSGGCNCKSHAKAMDQHGCDWCEQHIDTIVGWLSDEASKSKVLGFSLDMVPGFDVTARALVARAITTAREKAKAGTRTKPQSPFATLSQVPEFITVEQLMRDAKQLASLLPADTSQIIGIARSGLCVATMVAMLRHLPLTVFRQNTYDLLPGGNGWRLSGNVGYDKGPPVVIDDTCMSGNSFKYCMPVIRQQHPNAIAATVYCNPSARVKPDIWVRELGWPHLLEWNLFNSVLSPNAAVDFDGILCHDCPPGSDDDGPRYAAFLRDTKPLYVVRKVKIPLIVTARLEKYRAPTMEWLNRHGIAVERLIMGPWANLHERHRHNVADFKASHFSAFLKNRRGIKPAMFIESEEWQARRIAELSGGLVVCPAAGKTFQ